MLYSREHRRVRRLRSIGHIAKQEEISLVGDAVGNVDMAANGTSATLKIETCDEAWYREVSGSSGAQIVLFGRQWFVEQKFYTRPSIVEGGFKGIVILRRLESVS
jgi:hypothetical protein